MEKDKKSERTDTDSNGGDDSGKVVSHPQQVEEASVVKFFESNSNIGTTETVHESEDTRTQRQNLAVIRKLLAMFNLEDTKRKYETQNVVEYVLDPNDFGYDW